MDGARSLVVRYYAYRSTLSVGFITPIFALFVLRDLSFAEYGALSALYSALSIVGEVPTGYVGDRFGRRASLLLSVLFTVASLAGFVVAGSFLWYAVLYGLWAVALTFRSGSMDAWLYDVLDERLDTEAFSRVRGRGDAVQQWTSAAIMIAGGLLYGLHPTYPFLAAVGFNSLGVVALLSLPKNSRYVTDDHDDPDSGDALGPGENSSPQVGDDRVGPLEALPLIRNRLARPPLRSLVAYFGLFYAIVSVAQGYVQPMAVETFGPAVATFGVDLPPGGAATATRRGEVGAALALGLGVLYAGLSALASVGGYYAGTVERRLGTRGALLVVPLLTAVAMILPAGVGLLALPAFAVMRAGPPLARPVANGYLNDRLDSVGRATTLSAASMCYMSLRTPLAIVAGVVAGRTTATTAVATLGGVLLLVGGTVWLVGEVAPDSNADTASATR